MWNGRPVRVPRDDGDELVLHTATSPLHSERPFRPDEYMTRSILDRLFPWWPHEEDPWMALQWCSGRGPRWLADAASFRFAGHGIAHRWTNGTGPSQSGIQ